jgi:hypothetical protein
LHYLANATSNAIAFHAPLQAKMTIPVETVFELVAEPRAALDA